MAYETGTALSVKDILDKLEVFATSNGWTVNRSVSDSFTKELCINLGDNYVNLKAFENTDVTLNNSTQSNTYGIALNGSDSYQAGSLWNEQPGYPVRDTSDLDNSFLAFVPFVLNFGPFPAYHFYAVNGGACVYVELEIQTGIFLRFGFGSLDLYDSSTAGGGRFFYGTCSNHRTDSTNTNQWLGVDSESFYSCEETPFRQASKSSSNSGGGGSAVRCNTGSFDGWFGCANSDDDTALVQRCVALENIELMKLSPTPLNNLVSLVPVNVAINNLGINTYPLGSLPGIRYVNITNNAAGDEISIGSDVWQVFPWYNKGGRSYDYGLAYRKEL